MDLPSEHEIEIEQCRRSLSYFAKQAWEIVEPGRQYKHGWHIDAICAHLEAVSQGQIRNLLINMPPRHMKSLLVSVFWPCWEWTILPETRWLYSSYADSLSIRDSVKCRRIIQSPWYQKHFGHIYSLTNDQNEKKRFDNDRTGYRLSTSVGGAGTGEGGDRVIVDDPHKVGEADSKTTRDSALVWWDSEMSTRGNDPQTVAKVIVMQRVHQNDLSGHVLSQGGYEHLMLPAEYEGRKVMTSIGWEDPRKEKGELLWPDRFGKTELIEAKKRMGSRQAAGQLQQRPASEGGDIIKRDWIKFWSVLPDRFHEEIITVDATFTGKATSDFVAIQCWGRIGADKYLKDQVYEQMGIMDTIKALLVFCKRNRHASLKLIENKANGPAIEDVLKSKVSGMVLWDPIGDKVARLNAVAPQYEGGNVYLPSPQMYEWSADFLEELLTFPNSTHDDRVDASTMALLRLEESNTNNVGTIRIVP